MTSRRAFLLGFGTALLATPAFARTRFRQLFNGRNLDGWIPLGDANWSVENGGIMMPEVPLPWRPGRP